MAVLGAAAGGGGQLPTIAFFGSQTWTPSYDVTAKVFVIGGGGGGAAKYDANGKCSGGGAGGCAVSELTFSSGTAYTITIGAGGAGEQATSAAYGSDAAGNGDAGGNSSLSGSGITTMTANGGAGGVHVNSSGDACLGGAGGSASGGTLGNFTGGAGGLLTGIGDHSASGGGAVGLWTTGNAAPTGTTTANVIQMGASISWDYDTYAADHSLNAGHPTNSGVHNSPVATLPPFSDLEVFVREYQGTYYDMSISTHSGIGQHHKSGYVPTYKYLDYYYNNHTGISGPFCGGGGVSAVSQNTVAGRGCLGGGGGGAASSTNKDCYGGAGGSGGVLIFPSSIG